jgi:L-seryl-tRNA(Ser) seleniumtransferase
MLGQTEADLRARAERLQALVKGAAIERTDAFAGGGALPEERIASWALVLHTRVGAEIAAGILRSGNPAVIARINQGRLLLDMLTVTDEDLAELGAALRAVPP